MGDRNGDLDLVAEVLKLGLPQSGSTTVTSPSIGGDDGWASENWSVNNVSLRTLAKGVRRMKGKLRMTEEKVRILRQADGERTIL